MKLQVSVPEDDKKSVTVSAPEAQPEPQATIPTPSSKTNNSSSTVTPSSDGFINGGIGSLTIAFLFMVSTMFGLFYI